MFPDRRKLLYILLAATAYFAWSQMSRAVGEVATLHASGSGIDDVYAQVWVVEERPYYWLRAEKPSRRWLEAIHENPKVVLHLGEQRIRCEAEVRDDAESLHHVNALFRAKYALADLVRSYLARDPVPVRLLPIL